MDEEGSISSLMKCIVFLSSGRRSLGGIASEMSCDFCGCVGLNHTFALLMIEVNDFVSFVSFHTDKHTLIYLVKLKFILMHDYLKQ